MTFLRKALACGTILGLFQELYCTEVSTFCCNAITNVYPLKHPEPFYPPHITHIPLNPILAITKSSDV